MVGAKKIEAPREEESWNLVIEAGKTERHYWKDLWRYRELFWFLAWRDILVQYKQTVFGVAWSVIKPVLTMVIFTFVFGRIAKLPSDGLPYPILVYAAMLPWQFLATAFSEASGSLIGSANLISKVYFPRLIIPISKTIVSFVEFCVSFVIYLALMLYYHVPLTWKAVTLIPLLMLCFVTAIGPAFLVASMNVRYRDFRHIVPFLVQFGLYASPVGFSSTVVPAKWRLLYSMNPMVGVIDGFRWALTGYAKLYTPGLVASIILAVLLLVCGIAYFRRTERTFADVI